MKAVMYHYVRDFDNNKPHRKFLHYEQFCKQLDYFDSVGGFVTKDEWERFVKNGEMPTEKNKFILTFDDATSCHYEYVYPELKKRGLWGCFYVSALPYLESEMLDVHKIHQLTASISLVELDLALKKIIQENMFIKSDLNCFLNNTYTQQTNPKNLEDFKKTLNYLIKPEFRTGLVNELGKIFSCDFSVGEFYMSQEEILKLHKDGNIIGAHSVTHRALSQLNFELQKTEIKRSFKFISQLINVQTISYCHPYGGKHSYSDHTLNLLSETQCKFAFSVEPREIHPEDSVRHIYELPRFNCNQFLYGKACIN
jgi:peptidoglycan/xylan/chitin deacetylase (PgdA/CDA1 family)